MSDLSDSIIIEAEQLDRVPEASLKAYRTNQSLMTKAVNESMQANPSLASLIGDSGMPLMLDNHNNHAAFMATVFALGNYSLLARTIPWVYRTYHARGFSYDYFPAELACWIKAINQHMPSDRSAEILSVYEWMVANHETMIARSQRIAETYNDNSNQFTAQQKTFLEGLLEGDHRSCIRIAKQVVDATRHITPLYIDIIQPSMYEVGRLWETNRISVAEEHLASAIVGRVMASTDMLDFLPEHKPHKAVITAAPNEHHEIGAWMVSDIIESQGWEVKYLGANTPAADLIDLVRSEAPDLVAISATMAFNIDMTRGIINGIRSDAAIADTHVLVGGRIFNQVKDLWKSVGADHYAATVLNLKSILQRLEAA